MNWDKYFKETDERKRWDMLMKDNRLSYDHADNWIMSVKYYLRKEVLEEVMKIIDSLEVKTAKETGIDTSDVLIDGEDLKKKLEDIV